MQIPRQASYFGFLLWAGKIFTLDCMLLDNVVGHQSLQSLQQRMKKLRKIRPIEILLVQIAIRQDERQGADVVADLGDVVLGGQVGIASVYVLWQRSFENGMEQDKELPQHPAADLYVHVGRGYVDRDYVDRGYVDRSYVDPGYVDRGRWLSRYGMG